MQNTLVSPKAIALQPSGHINAANAVEFQRQLTAAVIEGKSAILVDL